MKNLFIIPIFLLISILFNRANAQGVLIEEFTNLGAVNYSQSHGHIDSLNAVDIYDNYCIITYHTDFPGVDPFNNGVTADVNRRLASLSGITELASSVVDGTYRSYGNYFHGATLNLSLEQLDSIKSNKPRDINFFGLALNFNDDFTKVHGSSGMSLLNSNTDLPVHHYRVLVEEVVNTDTPIGPNGESQFTNVFRGFISYRLSRTIPGNGSTHGWGTLDIPESVHDINKLKMIVFVTDLSGYVLDCTSRSVSPVAPYKIEVTNTSTPWSDYCDSIVVPAVSVKNVGPNTITGLSIVSKVDEQMETRYVDTMIEPNMTMKFVFDELVLEPGRHYIYTDVEYVVDAVNSAVIVRRNDSLRYLVSGPLDAPDENFEFGSADDIGGFMVRAQTDLAFKKTSAMDLGHDQKLGAYGESDYCLMVDQWNWDWDEEDAGNVFLRDNKNFGFLLYNNFDLTQIKYPTLYFDVAAATKPNHRCLEVGVSANYCGNNFSVRKSFSCHELNTAPQNISSFFIPDSSQWQTKSVSLYSFDDFEQVQLRFWTSNHVDFTHPNAFYVDNIRVVSDARPCVAGDMHFSSQADVDSFVARRNGCNIIDGDLCIGFCDTSQMESDITDLKGLASILEINGSLTIANNPMLTSTEGLSQLRTVVDDLVVRDNDSLRSLNALRVADYIGGSLRVVDNPILDTMLVFPQNQVIPGDFVVTGNPKLNYFWIGSLNGISGDCIIHDLEEVTSFGSATNFSFVGGDLSIQNNRSLKYARIFQDLTAINGNYIFKNNPELRSLFFLANTKIDGDIILEELDSLTSIAFSRLDSLGGNITIKNNPTLEYIISLNGINYDYFNSLSQHDVFLTLENNPSLSICNTELICRLLDDLDRDVVIADNGQQCRSEEEVIQACISGNAEVSAASFFTITPNPTTDYFQVQSDLERIHSVEVFFSNGTLAFSAQGEFRNQIDMRNLPVGLYFVRINSRYVQKVVKY